MAPRVPKIGKGVKVVTKKKPVRYGTVVDTAGNRSWIVEFKTEDGGVENEQLSSAQLGIYKEYYSKHSKTPVKSALKTLRKAVRQTVGRRSRHRDRQIQNRDSSSSNSDCDQNDDEEYVNDANKGASPSSDESPLLTPRTLSPVVLPRQRQLFAEDVSDDESAGSFDDKLDEDEDPDGTDQLQIIVPTEDGGEEVEFLNRPMKKAAYENSYQIMKEEKKRLIEEEYEIVKKVKTQNKYAVGGKVVGAPNTIHGDLTGTIDEVVGSDQYRID